MGIDPNDPVVKMCVEGINEEMAGNLSNAAKLYEKAWEQCTNELNSCIVAHYMARVQQSQEGKLSWNLKALDHANKAEAGSVGSFYPSLYLNVGKCYEDIGNNGEALKNYQLAESKCDLLAHDRLGDMTREGIQNGIARMAERKAS